MKSCKIHRHLLHYLLALSLATALSVVILNQVFVQRSSSYLNKFNFYGNSAKFINNCEGHFNVSVWDKGVCEGTYENVAQFPKFPAYPEHYYSAEDLSSVVENTEHPSIKRIQSYLQPKESGLYKFRVRASTMLRIFLETSHQSLDVIIEFSRGQNGVVYSKDYLLRSNHTYYFELLIFCHSGKNYFDVEWLVPDSAQFRAIKSRDLASGPSHVVPSQHPPLIQPLSINQNILLGFIPRIHIVKSFPACVSVNFRSSDVTPDTSVYTPPSPPAPWIESLVQLIKKCLQKAVPSKYPSLKLLKVESSQSSTQSDLHRLLVELELVVDGLNYKQRMSEYFYSWNNGSSLNLCRPLRYNWDNLITLNFVYLADCYENENVWAHYFIQNMIKILETSLDVNLKVIITTCDEQEARGYDTKLRSSGFDRYAVVLLDGVYTESRGMKAALSVVEDEKSIVVRCQSRVWMPTMIVEEVRKHTFINTMAYSPIPFQLDCGYFPGARSLDGEWCAECVALLSLYKHDWEIILTVKPEELQLRRSIATRSDNFLKDKQEVLRHISNFGIEIIQGKLNDLHQL